MSRNLNDLWSDINNPNNDANIDDWANANNPEHEDYYHEEEDYEYSQADLDNRSNQLNPNNEEYKGK